MRDDLGCRLWTPLSVAEVTGLFTACGGLWWLSGGQAIDHRLGRTTREHGDIDVSTLPAHLPDILGALPDHLEAFAAAGGELDPLNPLDTRRPDPGLRNVWVRDRRRDRWVLQVNLEAGEASSWRYRRDPRITLPWPDAVTVVDGVPTGTPATQLLWKSPSPRPQDEADRDAALPLLSSAERCWLSWAVRTAHPRSPWAADPWPAPPGA